MSKDKKNIQREVVDNLRKQILKAPYSDVSGSAPIHTFELAPPKQKKPQKKE